MSKNNLQESTEKMNVWIDQAVSGDRKALEDLLGEIQDMVFNLSLRMLGMIPDAEDASQEILIKVMTNLSSFKKESAFTTWVYRIAVNHLKNYKKSMFAKHPLSFEFYGADILCGKEKDIPDLTQGIDGALLEKELKLSCTNVMLQCLDAESRCIFILGTMFKADSRLAGEILGMTPEAYRQKLSRVRKKMAAFLDEYCGLSGKGVCSCKKRINYAIASHRLNPNVLEYSDLEEREEVLNGCLAAMETIDDLSLVFASFPAYRTPEKAKQFLNDFLQSAQYKLITDTWERSENG